MTHLLTYEPNGATRAVVTIDGVDVTNVVRRFSFDHAAGDLPKTFLELKPGVEFPAGISAETIVHIREVVQEEPADAMLRFIEPLDPEEFQSACLRVMELGGPTTFGEAALAVLKAYAAGETP